MEMERNPGKFLNETPPPARASRSGVRTPTLQDIDDGQELWELLQRQRDAIAFREKLSNSQLRILAKFEEDARERRARAMQEEMNAQVEVGDNCEQP
jgi:hypothetical protein